MSAGYILDHTAIRSLALGRPYMVARVFHSAEIAQPLYIPAVCFTRGLADSILGEVYERLQDALSAPSFVFRPLDEAACWAVAQIAHERATDIAAGHAAHLALSTGLPVLTLQPGAYKQIDARIDTEEIA
ncbi:hypothetical protein [Actinacidiphila soli]|uniref:hypothetical protein n=1 Tax=Actinacidiphila soli TaxID=2487275 RepID=UPI000FCC6DE7|nr:hypothetical protein [Actinacidiphila soli]